MNDADIREYLGRDLDEHDLCRVKHRDIRPLLKELLDHRNLRLTPGWRVWVPDQSPQGWRWDGMFPTKEAAFQYRQLIFRGDALVLPWNEQPALTAR